MDEKLNALTRGFKPWVVVTAFANGAVRECAQPFEASARRMAEREARNIGGPPCILTGAALVAVTVEHRPC